MYEKLIEEAKELTSEFFQTTQRVFSEPEYFAFAMQDDSATFRNACKFAAIVSFLLTAIGIVSYKVNHVPVDWEFITLESGVTWLIFVIFASVLWVFSKALGGRGTITKTICACFYASVLLVPIKVLEIPTRVIRDSILLQGPISKISIAQTRVMINTTAFKFEILVLIGLIVFLWLMTKMLKHVHAFGWIRQWLLFIFSFFLLTTMTNSLQENITQLLLKAFS